MPERSDSVNSELEIAPSVEQRLLKNLFSFPPLVQVALTDCEALSNFDSFAKVFHMSDL